MLILLDYLQNHLDAFQALKDVISNNQSDDKS